MMGTALGKLAFAAVAVQLGMAHGLDLRGAVMQRLEETTGLTSSVEIGKQVLELALVHLDELIKDADGKPNPRVTCTAGHDYAANYVATVLKN